LKKPTGSVRFRFYKPKTKKTKPNPNRKKTEPTDLNWFFPKKPNQTKTGLFEPVSVFLKKNFI
jgi:hypothetical protein